MVYQFAASAVPPEGYDAQCTACSHVFFVSRSAQPPAPAFEVAALYYAMDSDNSGKAGRLLGMQDVGRSRAAPRLHVPSTTWASFARALVLSYALDPGARGAFEAVLSDEPRFVRARVELAVFLDASGRTAEARPILEYVLKLVPTHERARLLLAQMVGK